MKTRISLSDRGLYYGEKWIGSGSDLGYWQSVTKEYLFKTPAIIALWLYKRRMLK